MSIQTLVEKIKEKGNPTVAGLDARLEYIPQHISGRNMMLHGETLRAAAESVVASTVADRRTVRHCSGRKAAGCVLRAARLLRCDGAQGRPSTTHTPRACTLLAISSATTSARPQPLTQRLTSADPRRRYRDRTVRLRFGYRKRLSRHRRCRAVPQGVPQPREEPVYAGKDL